MAQRSFHHRQKRNIAETPSSPGLLSTLFVFSLMCRSVAGILLSPLRFPLRAVIVTLSLWLLVGTGIYGSAYVVHLAAYKERVGLRNELLSQKAVWVNILSSHPTSKEALLGAYAASVSLGEDSQAHLYLQQLERIDPNDPRIQALSINNR